MKYRKLRIAWSVVWSIACMLLVALWVRSNWYLDGFWFPTPFGCGIGLVSAENSVSLTLEQGIPDADYMGFQCYDVNRNSNLRPVLHYGFRFGREPGGMSVFVPFWFLLGLTAGTAAAPWILLRFSLRALLIGMTVAAIGLGWIVYTLRK